VLKEPEMPKKTRLDTTNCLYGEFDEETEIGKNRDMTRLELGSEASIEKRGAAARPLVIGI
jgi:hypothetical protein